MNEGLRANSHGFSLLEVLVALFVMSLVFVAISQMIGTGSRVWDAATDYNSTTSQSISRLKFRSDIEDLQLVTVANPLADRFSAMPSVLQFGNQRGSVALDGSTLVYKTNAGANLALRSDVARLRFSYFGRRNVTGNREWIDNWDDGELLPELIKIESWDVDGHVNAPLIVRPAASRSQRRISLFSPVPPG